MAGLVDERGGAAVHLGLQARVSRLSGSWSPWAARHAPLLTTELLRDAPQCGHELLSGSSVIMEGTTGSHLSASTEPGYQEAHQLLLP